MPHNEHSPGIATPDEVLQAVTRMMNVGEKESDQLKAADMLAKHHGLLTPREEAGFDPELTAMIDAAVAAIASEYEEPEPDAKGSDPSADDPAGDGGPVVRP